MSASSIINALPADFGLVVAVSVGFYIQQSILFVIPVAMQRGKTGIKPPTLYPTDSQIKDLKLTETQVTDYMCAQRVHQNNMEFLTVFMPIFLLAGLFEPRKAAIAGALVWAGRLTTALGYLVSPKWRVAGAW